jgi:hypothetical protein
MSPESNVTFDHIHVIQVVIFVSCIFSECNLSLILALLIAFQARDSPETFSTSMDGSSILSSPYYELLILE